jgi:hypothetical protein
MNVFLLKFCAKVVKKVQRCKETKILSFFLFFKLKKPGNELPGLECHFYRKTTLIQNKEIIVKYK